MKKQDPKAQWGKNMRKIGRCHCGRKRMRKNGRLYYYCAGCWENQSRRLGINGFTKTSRAVGRREDSNGERKPHISSGGPRIDAKLYY